MIRPNEDMLEAIVNLKNGNQSNMFDTFVLWLHDSLQKENKTAVYNIGPIERTFACGRVQELEYILNAINNAESKLKEIEIGKKINND